MFKKLFFSLCTILILIIVSILLTPISLLQNEILEYLNTNSSFSIEIKKPINYRLINAGKVSIEEIHLKLPSYDIFIDKVDLNLDLNSLLKKDIIVKSFNLEINSIREIAHTFPKESKKSKVKIGVESLTIENISIDIDNILIKKYQLENLVVSSKRIELDLKSNTINGEVDFSLFKKGIDGKAIMSVSSTQEVSLDLNVINIDKLSKKLNLRDVNLFGDLTLKFKGDFESYSDMLGNNMSINLSGHNLKWIGKDLDNILNAYIDSRKLGLLDVAGYLTLGPIGILVAKGTDLSNTGIRGIINGETEIKEIFSSIKLENKIVKLIDVAMSTKEHRIVVNGKINLNRNEFEDFKVGTVDEKGCSIFVQEISGKLSSPEIGALGSIMNETLSKFKHLFKAGLSLIIDNCEDKYLGVVR